MLEIYSINGGVVTPGLKPSISYRCFIQNVNCAMVAARSSCHANARHISRFGLCLEATDAKKRSHFMIVLCDVSHLRAFVRGFATLGASILPSGFQVKFREFSYPCAGA